MIANEDTKRERCAAISQQLHRDDRTRRHEVTKARSRSEPAILVIATGDWNNSGTTEIGWRMQIYADGSGQNGRGDDAARLIIT